MNRLAILNECNTNEEFKGVKKRTVFFRGHYSYRRINYKCRDDLLNFLLGSRGELLNLEDDSSSSIAVQFRLGDLVNLESKSYIPPERIAKEIIKASTKTKNNKVQLFSDSPQLALSYLQFLCPGIEFDCQQKDSLSTLFELAKSKIFIGSNSKITLWATMIRFHLSKDTISVLPQELHGQILKNLGLEFKPLIY